MNNNSFRHSVDVQIRFSDIDPLNHVNNSIISQYYDIGRINYLKEVLGEDIEWNSIGVVIVNLNTNFFSPVFITDQIVVETRLIGFGEKSMRTMQRVRDKNTQEIKSTCETILSGFDVVNNESAPIPDDIKKKFEDYEKGIMDY